MSGSLGSWLVAKVIDTLSLQIVEDKESDTDGEKAIHGNLFVVPSTQLPQLSTQAVPFGVPLQSKEKFAVWKLSIADQEELLEIQKDFNCQI